MIPRTVVAWRGPSVLTGDPVEVLLTGLAVPSHNEKTGHIAQAWILRSDIYPVEVYNTPAERAVCGDCPLRGSVSLQGQLLGGRAQRSEISARACYVTGRAMMSVGNAWKRHFEPDLEGACRALSTLRRRMRIGAYGDPAAVPFGVWAKLVKAAGEWTGYTHQWRTCDQRFRDLVMASVETQAQAAEAQALGWRTFRIRPDGGVVNDDEIICPNETRGILCVECKLCCGQQRPAKSIVITAHGQERTIRAIDKLVKP